MQPHLAEAGDQFLGLCWKMYAEFALLLLVLLV